MAAGEAPRKADRARWRREIVRHLEAFPRQYAALESAMGAFGDDFDLQPFKLAFETLDDMEDYNRAQAVERALGRVQNFVADLAIAGAKLAELDPPGAEGRGSAAQRAFESLCDAGVIGRELCRRLVRAQVARSAIEHAYVEVPAGDVHRAALLIHRTARDFAAAYRPWIAPYLEPDAD